MTWGQLRDASLTAACRARDRWDAAKPVVLVTENSGDGLAVFLGLLTAGIPVLCVEPANSVVADEGSVVSRLDKGGVVAAHPTDGVSFADLLAPTDPPVRWVEPPADVPVLQLTSGSTGEPRIAKHGLASCTRGGLLYRDLHRYTSTDAVLLPVPMAHSFGLVGGVAAALVSGAELVMLPRFGLRAFYDGLACGATVVLGTPLLYRMVAQAGPTVDRAPRVALSSGGPLADDVAEAAARRLGTPVREVYGSTETGLIACRHDRAEPWPAGSVGATAPGVTCWSVPDEESGGERLVVRTSTMFEGYLDPAGGSVVDAPGNGYDTGDLGTVDDAGHVFLAGRKQVFVNVGGRKVNPRRVERLIRGHAAVDDVHVFGLEEDGEEVVHAAVVLASGGSAAEVMRYCRDRLAPYEGPHRLHVVPRLPRTGMGKVAHADLMRTVSIDAADRG